MFVGACDVNHACLHYAENPTEPEHMFTSASPCSHKGPRLRNCVGLGTSTLKGREYTHFSRTSICQRTCTMLVHLLSVLVNPASVSSTSGDRLGSSSLRARTGAPARLGAATDETVANGRQTFVPYIHICIPHPGNACVCSVEGCVS